MYSYSHCKKKINLYKWLKHTTQLLKLTNIKMKTENKELKNYNITKILINPVVYQTIE